MSVELQQLNWLAIVVAAVAGYFPGAIWYSPIGFLGLGKAAAIIRPLASRNKPTSVGMRCKIPSNRQPEARFKTLYRHVGVCSLIEVDR